MLDTVRNLTVDHRRYSTGSGGINVSIGDRWYISLVKALQSLMCGALNT